MYPFLPPVSAKEKEESAIIFIVSIPFSSNLDLNECIYVCIWTVRTSSTQKIYLCPPPAWFSFDRATSSITGRFRTLHWNMISLQRRTVSVGEQYTSFSREVITSATVYPL